jgi:dihydrodipicolinate synthase/N-acetylneuraminate lyase
MGRLSLFLALLVISPVSAQCGLFPPGHAPAPCTVPFVPGPQPCARPCWGGGIYPTVLTPWNCTGCGVDTAALAAQIQYQLCGGVHGLLLLGTLGEGMYASDQERAEVITTAVAVVAGKVPIVVGIHTGDIQCGLAQLRQAKALGAQAVLVKYTGPAGAPFCEVLGFYHALASAGELPIFYYHYPGGVDRPLSPPEVIQVLSLPNVVGAKESTLDLREVEAHINGVAGLGRVFLSGTALNLTQFQKAGGHGAMSPEAAILPADTVAAYETAYGIGDRRAARAQQRDLFVVAPLLKGGLITERGARAMMMTAQDLKLPQRVGRDESQARLKAALGQLGVPMSPVVKPPLPGLSFWDEHIVRSTVRKIERR